MTQGLGPELEHTPGRSYDPTQKPPPFGRQLKQYFALDKEYVNLNHDRTQPDKFHRLLYKPMLVKSRENQEVVAKLIGSDVDEVVFVPNASHAANKVLRNFEWRDGDLVIGPSTTYGQAFNVLKYLSDRSEQPKPTLVSIQYNFPLTDAEIIETFRTQLRQYKREHAGTQFTDVPSLSPGFTADVSARKNKIVAVIDGFTANPGALMPWRELVRICHEEGVWALIDAAHSIGQEPNINLREAQPDFWLSSCHKWFFAKRGCAVLYVPERNQHLMKSSIPTSHEYVSSSRNTCRPARISPNNMNVTPALALREWLGGEQTIYDYCHTLALEGAQRLAQVLSTKVMDENGELTVYMPNVQLPLPIEKQPGQVYSPELIAEINALFTRQLLLEWNTYTTHYFHNGAWWCRCSAQVYNELSDFEYLGKALVATCENVVEKLFS
ncbi:PLP-dependent transferase [Lentinus tigrinus ALCF2SS1-7]|uniref:PLP-dependent transferase n=1 Tax=Lentinus tigrinus ALCF2SS1-7 TaxID=1328758 RepID=UPI001166228D|nr:PLP-dependent transferase [Lentinus tigrinus ALCF2SS1-7]